MHTAFLSTTCDLLQRSRRPKTAESASPIPPVAVREMLLQRSRRPKTAERPPGGSPLGRWSPRFNGAAVRRRRRVIAGIDRAGEVRVASTEPPSEDGGEQSRRSAPRAHRPASTEPPSEDGGEEPATRRPLPDPNASTEPPSEDGGETELQVMNPVALDLLQRSRRPKTAERFEAGKLRERLSKASTEPPSEDGGEATRRSLSLRRPVRFNGAAVRRRRRGVQDSGTTSSFLPLQRSRRPKTAESPSDCAPARLE